MDADPDIAARRRAFDRQCVDKLKPVRFGSYRSIDRIVEGIGVQLDKGQALTARQRLSLYGACWSFREQIADWKVTAQVLIAERLLVESCDTADLLVDRVKVRAWQQTTPAAQREMFQVVS